MPRARAPDPAASAARAAARIHTVWQIKASTLCNLRCRYCYEWDRLGDARRITLSQWRAVLRAAAHYHRVRAQRIGPAQQTLIAWHGGEASLLPVRYVGEVLAAQAEELGTAALASGAFVNAVVTNLYRINATLKRMLDEGFVLSVSLDGAPGARVTKSGRDAEAAVLANLARLLADGAEAGVALVLGRHNVADLNAIHDRLEDMGARWLRIIPMMTPPASAPGDALEISATETVAALGALMRHRDERGSRMTVAPLNRIERTVVSLHAGGDGLVHDRDAHGETRFIVHPDGRLAVDAASSNPTRVLGNVFQQPMDAILASPAYRASLAFDRQRRQRHCVGCRYQHACDQRAVTEYPVQHAAGPCPVESHLCAAREDMHAAA